METTARLIALSGIESVSLDLLVWCDHPTCHNGFVVDPGSFPAVEWEHRFRNRVSAEATDCGWQSTISGHLCPKHRTDEER